LLTQQPGFFHFFTELSVILAALNMFEQCTMVESRTDLSLLNGCIEGDRLCQAKLYARYAPAMLRICLWYAGSREEAEEILQDGFMRVFCYLRMYKGEGSLEGWIRKVMINAALSACRNRPGEQRWMIELDPEEHSVAQAPSFLYRYDEQKLVHLVRSLPCCYRQVFQLYVMEGWKHREIAKALAIAEGTSRSNLADARRLLQKELTKGLHPVDS
jgi:RNA polymerase sigma factor (sigma-70 family)